MGTTDQPDLAGDLQAAGDILKRLESAIALIKPPEQGFTAPGAYLMQLLGRVGASARQCRLLAHMLLTASTTGGDASAPAPSAEGARWVAVVAACLWWVSHYSECVLSNLWAVCVHRC